MAEEHDREGREGDEPRGGGAGGVVLWAFVALAVVGAVGLVAWGVRRAQATKLEQERQAAERLKGSVPLARAEAPLRMATLRETVELTGTLRAAREVRVVPEPAGKIERLLVAKGDRVEAGQVLMVLESDVLRAQLEQGQAAHAVAVSMREQARVARENAESDLRRIRGLMQTNSVSERDVERAETMFKTAEAQMKVADAGVGQAQAALKLARIQLSKATVTAPFEGLVADDYDLAVGQMVGPQMPVARVADVSELRVTARATEIEFARIAAGQKAEVRVAGHGARVFHGEVATAGPTVDPISRTAAVEIAVSNAIEGGRYVLAAGVFANVSVTLSERTDVLVVRDESLTTDGEGNAVLVLVPEAPGASDAAGPFFRIQTRRVTLGIRSGGLTEVVDGLAAADLVVTAGVRALAPGALVRLEGAAEAEK